MSGIMDEHAARSALEGSLRDYLQQDGAHLQTRVEAFFEWQHLRRRQGLWPYSRASEESPSTFMAARDDAGRRVRGVNFASQDYLSLCVHPDVKQVAMDVIAEFGLHSAGSPALLGNTPYSVALEQHVADFLNMPEALLFPTGWAAGYGVIKGLIRPTDHVVLDALSHSCLQEGASAATHNVHRFRHNDLAECRARLEEIRAQAPHHAIMVVTESLFSMNSDSPNIAALQELCHGFDATLVVDVAHDLGNLGKDGKGVIGDQGMLGRVDLVMGSFSKTFCSNGGFVACHTRALKEYLRFYSPPCIFSNALSPAQAATVLKAFEIIEGAEGQRLRDQLMGNILELRRQLEEAGFEVYGEPSAIVCVKIGAEALARLVSRHAQDAGLLANLVEYPAVAKGKARFRLQVMARHTDENIRDAVAALRAANIAGRSDFAQLGLEWLRSSEPTTQWQ
ncbi:aminotransferase class I/II-fold pyridoxal phosphate-dependent enzyme [Myxococcus fulvus]|uniref:aminotransferase class I/II-fold pyridoxal phosphate-dependent enzyme n=1 Tax=Myxococcus fulvus TaxID=33 RepID=UPI003B9B435D